MSMDWDDICADVIEYFKEVPEEFIEVARDLDGYDSILTDNEEVNDYMEYLDDVYYERALDLIHDGLYGNDEDGGNFNLDREYFYYNGYGNLVSTDTYYNSDGDYYTDYLDEDVVRDLYEYRDSLDLPRYIVRLFDYWESASGNGGE